MKRMRAATLVVACAAALWASTAAADEVADFYKGKTFTLVVGHEVGTGYDVYARTLSRHLGQHIPGNPAVVVQNMVGASGLVAANWLYNIAPKDGTVAATFVPTTIFESLFGNPAAKFEAGRFTWIGNIDDGINICGVSKASGIGRFEDLQTRETVFGGTGATGPLGKSALAVKHLLGAKIKLVSGYQGSASVKFAMNRGEVHGICGISLSSVTSQWRDELESGAFKPILQLSGNQNAILAGVAHVDTYAKSLEDQQVFSLIFGVQSLNRNYGSPPGMPAERTRALRAAFMATMADPQFRADAAKMQIDVNPASGEEVAAFIARIAASPPQVVERTKLATRAD
jgi:tripartite-type tricarboxylate transporter receptor subunit TctC